MNDLLSWPALRGGKVPPPGEIHYERGIWGKVHAARTDFRWVARSGGFETEGPELELGSQISLGAEDQPSTAQLWCNLEDRCLAVGFYPSRAMDASGRTSFLEKQVLAWPRAPEVPAVLGALLLLPHVESLTDDIWWDRRDNGAWEDPDFSLPIASAGHEPLSVTVEQLDANVRQGVNELRDSVELDDLKRLYAQILAGRRPACLNLEKPLSPRALAVLLLPLPRTIADSLSLAGWIPSGRASFKELAARWDVLVLPPDLREPIESEEFPPETADQGWALASGLLELDLALLEPVAYALEAPPPEPREESRPAAAESPRLSALAALRPRAKIPLPAPPTGASALLRELHAFAQAVDRRWLDLDALSKDMRHLTRVEEIPERLFPSWIETLRQRKPEHASAVQWQVKLDVLRSAALVLRPAAGTLQSVGLPESGRVPALLFASLLEKRDLLAEMGEDSLSQTLRHSLGCLPDPRARQIHTWILQWQPKKNLWLKSLITRELEAVKAR